MRRREAETETAETQTDAKLEMVTEAVCDDPIQNPGKLSNVCIRMKHVAADRGEVFHESHTATGAI